MLNSFSHSEFSPEHSSPNEAAGSGGSRGREVFLDAVIYTAEKGQPFAEALVTEAGRILFVGSSLEARKWITPETQVEHLGGKLLLPGLIDSHCHPLFLGMALGRGCLILSPFWGHEKVLRKVKEYAQTHPEKKVIRGFGFHIGACDPLAVELDRVVRDRPVLLVDSDLHTGWVNTAAMKQAGLSSQTPDPYPHFFERDANGVPTGKLVEMNAILYVERKLGEAGGPEDRLVGLEAVLERFSSLGFTGLFDAGLGRDSDLQWVRELEKAGGLKLRYFRSHFVNPSHQVDVEGEIQALKKMKSEFGSELIHPTALKLQGDGTAEAHTARMLKPYSGDPADRGILFFDQEVLFNLCSGAVEAGFDLHIHAIGDETVSNILSLYKRIDEHYGSVPNRKTMAHCQELPSDGLERFIEQKNVFYQTTPVWMIDPATEEEEEPVYLLQMYPLRSLVQGGVKLTFGSDCPVGGGFMGASPFLNMGCAVMCEDVGKMRIPQFGGEVRVILPCKEGLDVCSAVDAYTLNCAEQLGCEKETGSLAPGKSADFILVDHNIFKATVSEICHTRVLRTYFRGELVYEAPQ